MFGLRTAFFNGLSGLRVSQAALATVSHNIANADTEGYSRQRVEIAARNALRLGGTAGLGYGGQGAYIQQVSRADENFLELQVLRDRTLKGFFGGREETLSIVERLYTEGGTPTLSDAFDNFFNAARELSQDPSSFGSRGAFMASVDDVASTFRTMANDLQVAQRGIDDSLGGRLEQVNRYAAKIAEMNARIVSTEVDGSLANDFRDARDLAIRELSELIDVNVLPQADGSVSVEVANSYTIVQGDLTGRLEGVGDPANNGLMAVEFVGINGQRLDVTTSLGEGAIGGLIDVRDRIIAGQLNELDQLAFTFVNEVNAIHRNGFGLDGVNGRDLFVPPAGVGFAAANVTVDPAIAADPNLAAAALDPAAVPGDNRNLLALADLQHTAHVALGDVSFNRYYGELLHQVGTEASNNRDRVELHSVRAEQSEAMREAVEGVSIDDEMIDLTRFQKHFEANTRIITTVDRLLDSVLELVR